VREALSDSVQYCFPSIVSSGVCKYKDAETVTPDEFQRRKVSGDLPLFWAQGDIELGYASFLQSIESGVNVAIQVPQCAIPKVEKLFFYYKKRVIYITASEEVRRTRATAAGKQYEEPNQAKPQGPHVSTVVNSGTITEGAADVIAAMKQHSKQTMEFPPQAVTLTVLRNAQNQTREYLSEQVIPGLTNALETIVSLPVKPRNPYLWLSEFLENNANHGANASLCQAEAVTSARPLLETGSFQCCSEESQHILDEPARLDGVANLRRSPNHERIVGVQQPSIKAIREVVADLCGTHGKVVWVCVRDTPVVYVNGEPHTLQSKDKPGEPPMALRAQCISDGNDLQRVERQLVKELKDHSSKQGGKIQLVGSTTNKDAANVEPEPTDVAHDGVKTLQDIFDSLEAEGFDVVLKRAMLPSDCGAPEPEEIDAIVSAVREINDGRSAAVFSCSTGVGATELAMVL